MEGGMEGLDGVVDFSLLYIKFRYTGYDLPQCELMVPPIVALDQQHDEYEEVFSWGVIISRLVNGPGSEFRPLSIFSSELLEAVEGKSSNKFFAADRKKNWATVADRIYVTARDAMAGEKNKLRQLEKCLMAILEHGRVGCFKARAGDEAGHEAGAEDGFGRDDMRREAGAGAGDFNFTVKKSEWSSIEKKLKEHLPEQAEKKRKGGPVGFQVFFFLAKY